MLQHWRWGIFGVDKAAIGKRPSFRPMLAPRGPRSFTSRPHPSPAAKIELLRASPGCHSRTCGRKTSISGTRHQAGLLAHNTPMAAPASAGGVRKEPAGARQAQGCYCTRQASWKSIQGALALILASVCRGMTRAKGTDTRRSAKSGQMLQSLTEARARRPFSVDRNRAKRRHPPDGDLARASLMEPVPSPFGFFRVDLALMESVPVTMSDDGDRRVLPVPAFLDSLPVFPLGLFRTADRSFRSVMSPPLRDCSDAPTTGGNLFASW